MSRLPSRPDLDQLRRQARELLRSALADEPAATMRIRAVSRDLTLSAAQLALAREHGFPSWPALRAAAEARRLAALAAGQPPVGAESGPPPVFGVRRSFGGFAIIETRVALLHVEGLVAGPEGATDGPARATLFARLVPRDGAPALVAPGDAGPAAFADRLTTMKVLAQLSEVTLVDDRGAPFTMASTGTSTPPGREWIDCEFRVDPVPRPGVRWLEIGGLAGTAARLLPSPRAATRAATRAGQVTPVTGSPAERDLARRARLMTAVWLGTPAGSRAKYGQEAGSSLLAEAEQVRHEGALAADSDLPEQIALLHAALAGDGPYGALRDPWAGILAADGLLDGALHHRRLGLTLPPVAGATLRLDALTCTPRGWRLHLRSAGRWPTEVRRDDEGNLADKWASIEADATDDRGNSYIGIHGAFSGGDGGIDRRTVEFRTRLDPLARRLAITFSGSAEQVTADLDLA